MRDGISRCCDQIMKNILCVFGTRPEAVKMAPVILALRKRRHEFRCAVVVTAQHRDMLDQVLALFGIRPDYDLNVMTNGQSLTTVTVRVLERLEPVFSREQPDLVLVHGDTTSTLAASLAAFYQGAPLGHVEAGLRSLDKKNPYPEELNRVVADAIGDLHLAPTIGARRNLTREGIRFGGIFVTGNTGIDALHIMMARLRKRQVPLPSRSLRRLTDGPCVLLTAHRRENFGKPLDAICRAVAVVARRRQDVQFIYPVHPNPNVTVPVHEALGDIPNVHLLPPLQYSALVYCLSRVRFVVTDSGGLQEEGPALGKPVLVLRNVTERPEAVEAGTARVVGTNEVVIRRWMDRLFDDPATYSRMANAVNPYGDGRAAARTVQAIRFSLGLRRTRPREFQSV